jgi:hypothetical protein
MSVILPYVLIEKNSAPDHASGRTLTIKVCGKILNPNTLYFRNVPKSGLRRAGGKNSRHGLRHKKRAAVHCTTALG